MDSTQQLWNCFKKCTLLTTSPYYKKRRKQKSAYPGTPMQGVGKNQGLKITKIKFVRQKK
jgi:hypothetical protein